MSRAGLNSISLLCFLAFIGFVASSPVPERLSYLVHRADEAFINKLLARSFEILFADRELNTGNPAYIKRDYFSPLEDRGIADHLNSYAKLGNNDLSAPDKRDTYSVEHEQANDDKLKTHRLQRRSILSKMKHAFHHAFNKIKQGVQKAANKIKQTGKTVGKGLQKAGHYLKEKGAKIGKFGLKLLAAAASAAGRVVKFIPGIGTAVSMSLKGIAMGANIASDKIHAHLGGALGKIAGGLDYVISPMGTASKKLGGGAAVAANLFGRE